MSDDSDAESSASEDIATTGLIATRAKRSTAGNLYHSLIQPNLDDDALRNELLEDEEGDEGEFEGSDKDTDDALSSSDDDEDAGPPQEGDKEDLAGERELKRQEREQLKQARQKRKMEEAKMRISTRFQPKKKKVKLADDVKTEDGASTPGPSKSNKKKKSERQDWRPTEAEMPVRQSTRSTAVANREMVHSNLVESIKRSEKQKKIMANAAKREKANARSDLTQEERFAKAAKIEKETAKEFGKLQREEAERQRLREEALAAKRRRVIDGPVIRHWSGSVLWEGDKIKLNRLHGSQKIEEIKDGPDIDGGEVEDTSSTKSTAYATTSGTPVPPSVPATPGFAGSRSLQPIIMAPQPQPHPPAPPAVGPSSWLDGIYEYASGSGTSTPGLPPLYTPSTPAIHTPLQAPNSLTTQTSSDVHILNQPTTYHALPPHTHSFSQFQLNAPIPQTPPTPAVPLIKQQAQRSLVMLDAFEKLEVPTTTKRGSSKSTRDAALEPTPVASILLPFSYPSLTPDEARYLTHRKRATAKDPLPPPPAKARCSLTPFFAKFRDPDTGIPYAGLAEYRAIKRLLVGGYQWSSLLGAWVGPTYRTIGRPANGVPEGFAQSVGLKGKGKQTEERV